MSMSLSHLNTQHTQEITAKVYTTDIKIDNWENGRSTYIVMSVCGWGGVFQINERTATFVVQCLNG
jgi:hypothetical protein